jgi:hypothetical protein
VVLFTYGDLGVYVEHVIVLDVLVDNHISYFAQLAREDFLELRQEANELQEYSNAKLDRVTRYLGVLAEKTRKLGKGLYSAFWLYGPW